MQTIYKINTKTMQNRHCKYIGVVGEGHKIFLTSKKAHNRPFSQNAFDFPKFTKNLPNNVLP
jgi:hypothetical protein